VAEPAEILFIDGDDARAKVPVRRRIFTRQPIDDALDFGADVGNAGALSHASEEPQRANVARLRDQPGRLPEREPDLAAGGKSGFVGGDADNGRGRAIDQNRCSDNRRIAAVSGAPYARPDHRHSGGPFAVVFTHETAPSHRRRADQVERVGGHVRRVEPLRGTRIAADGDGRGGERGDGVQAARRVTDCREVFVRNSAVRTAIVEGGNVKDTVGAGDRESAHRMRVQDREEHVVHADADGEHEDGGGGEAAIAPQQSQRKPDVLDKHNHLIVTALPDRSRTRTAWNREPTS
jgi:hypothetical protein